MEQNKEGLNAQRDVKTEFERRLGLIFTEGERKHGMDNWRRGVGDKAYQLDRANRALTHLKIYLLRLEFGVYLGEVGEDDLAKVGWFCITQAETERLEHELSGESMLQPIAK